VLARIFAISRIVTRFAARTIDNGPDARRVCRRNSDESITHDGLIFIGISIGEPIDQRQLGRGKSSGKKDRPLNRSFESRRAESRRVPLSQEVASSPPPVRGICAGLSNLKVNSRRGASAAHESISSYRKASKAPGSIKSLFAGEYSSRARARVSRRAITARNPDLPEFAICPRSAGTLANAF